MAALEERLGLLGNLTWLADYVLRGMQRESAPPGETVHILWMVADHWEPSVGGASADAAAERAKDWESRYPRAARAHVDADGCAPRHTFFYPWDEYRRSELELLAGMSADGWGEVELHLHHSGDTGASLARKLTDAVGLYREGSCFGTRPDGRPAFGFVHGNWALDNSRHECGKDFCGVNDELVRLRDAGCYADFTFPALGFSAQPRWVNRVLHVTDDPLRPKSYDRGVEARVGVAPSGDLTLVNGTVGIYRDSRGRVRLNEGHLTGGNPATPERIDAWVRAGVTVRGRPEWRLVKLHTHGCSDSIRGSLLGGALERMWSYLESAYNDGIRYRLHYVTAREAYNIIRAAEDGHAGDPGAYRDYKIGRPPCRSSAGRFDGLAGVAA